VMTSSCRPHGDVCVCVAGPSRPDVPSDALRLRRVPRQPPGLPRNPAEPQSIGLLIRPP